MKPIIYLSFFLICYFTYGFFLSQYQTNFISRRDRPLEDEQFFDYKGVINIHTNKTIGSASHSFIIDSAKEAGLNFVIFSDLNLFSKDNTHEGYFGNLLSMVGGKYSFLDSRFIEVSKLQHQVYDSAGAAHLRLTDYVSQAAEFNKDQLLILAHPFNTGFTWNGEFPPGIDGFEFLNLKTMSIRAWKDSKLSTLWSVIIYPFNPRLAFYRLFSEPIEEADLLNHVGISRPVFLYAGAEASARAIPLANYLIRFPSYQKTFEIMSNHVLLRSELTGSYKIDRSKIFEALKTGCFYLAMDILGNPKGFSAVIENHGRTHMMGSQLKHDNGQVLKVKLGSIPTIPYEIVVLRNEERVETRSEPTLEYPISEPGTYRVQVRIIPLLPLPDAKKWLTWIYSNPFFVR